MTTTNKIPIIIVGNDKMLKSYLKEIFETLSFILTSEKNLNLKIRKLNGRY